ASGSSCWPIFYAQKEDIPCRMFPFQKATPKWAGLLLFLSPPALLAILPPLAIKPVTPADWLLGDRMYGTPTKETGRFTRHSRTFTSFRSKPLPQRSGFFVTMFPVTFPIWIICG